ncbi:MAG: hypothetical protein HYZ35_04680 [Chloroflexi bacterium]|nr:hypothetical protein [Chloroflexota bacterium]
MPVKKQTDFAAVHASLRAIMQKYEGGSLQVTADTPDNFELVGPATELSRGRELWFGAVQTRKKYVSYHLMAVYAFPELLEGMSPELKKRMQGKACFNFKTVDDKLFKELARLTGRGYRRFMKAKMID